MVEAEPQAVAELPVGVTEGAERNPKPLPPVGEVARPEPLDLPSPWDFDIRAMADRRQANAALLTELLRPHSERIEPLWGAPGDNVPQTYPVRIHGASRDRLYEVMNAAGFGVVSLYHTMIDSIGRDAYPASHSLSRCILNLPVHHEAQPSALRAMVNHLDQCVDELSRQ